MPHQNKEDVANCSYFVKASHLHPLIVALFQRRRLAPGPRGLLEHRGCQLLRKHAQIMHPLFSARVPLVRRYAHIHVCLCDHAIREARLPLSACTCSSCSSAHSCTTRLRSSKFPVPPPRSRSTHPQRRTAAPKMDRSAGPATPATTPVTKTLHAKVCAACLLCIAFTSE